MDVSSVHRGGWIDEPIERTILSNLAKKYGLSCRMELILYYDAQSPRKLENCPGLLRRIEELVKTRINKTRDTEFKRVWIYSDVPPKRITFSYPRL